MSKKNKTTQQAPVKDTEVKDNKSTKQTQVNNPQKPKEEKKPEVEKEKNPTPPPVDPAVETVATEEIKPEPKEEAPQERYITHRKYGKGKVVAEDEAVLTAEFPGYGEKEFLKAFCGMEYTEGSGD